MRTMIPRFVAAWLVVGMVTTTHFAGAQDDREEQAREARLAQIIAAVRAEEAKYRNVEYVLRTRNFSFDGGRRRRARGSVAEGDATGGSARRLDPGRE